MLDIASMPARATKTTATRPEGRSGNPREVEATGVRLRGLATRGYRLRPFPRMSQTTARQRWPTVRGAGCCPPDVFVFVPELRPGHSQRVSPLRTPDSGTPRSLRRRSAVARLWPSGVLRRHHRDRLLHIRSPSRGSRRPRSSERTSGLRGPNASSPISPHAGGLSGVGDRHSALWSATRGSGGTTHPGPRPCQASFRSIGSATAPSGWSNIRAIPSRPSTDTLRCARLFARTRTEVRAWRHPQASHGQEVYRVPPTRHRAGAA